MIDRLSRLQFRLARLEANDYRHRDNDEIENLRRQVAAIKVMSYQHPGRRKNIAGSLRRPGLSDNLR